MKAANGGALRKDALPGCDGEGLVHKSQRHHNSGRLEGEARKLA